MAEGDVADPPRVAMTLQEQADFVLHLWDRTKMPSDGTPAKEAILMLDRLEADALYALGHRLARMAPYENEVRELVTGRRG